MAAKASHVDFTLKFIHRKEELGMTRQTTTPKASNHHKLIKPGHIQTAETVYNGTSNSNVEQRKTGVDNPSFTSVWHIQNTESLPPPCEYLDTTVDDVESSQLNSYQKLYETLNKAVISEYAIIRNGLTQSGPGNICCSQDYLNPPEMFMSPIKQDYLNPLEMFMPPIEEEYDYIIDYDYIPVGDMPLTIRGEQHVSGGSARRPLTATSNTTYEPLVSSQLKAEKTVSRRTCSIIAGICLAFIAFVVILVIAVVVTVVVRNKQSYGKAGELFIMFFVYSQSSISR